MVVVVVVVDDVELLVVGDATEGAGVAVGGAAAGGEPPLQPARAPNTRPRTAKARPVAENVGIDRAPCRRAVFPALLVVFALAYAWPMSGLLPVEPSPITSATST